MGAVAPSPRPRRAPHGALLVGAQEHRHGLPVDRCDNCVRRRRQKAVDEMRAGDRFRLGAAVVLHSVQIPCEGEKRPIPFSANPTTSRRTFWEMCQNYSMSGIVSVATSLCAVYGNTRRATWRSGYAAVCKTVYTSSILVVASTLNSLIQVNIVWRGIGIPRCWAPDAGFIAPQAATTASRPSRAQQIISVGCHRQT